MNDLDLIGDEDEIVPEAFAVDTMEKADWCLRKKAREEAEIDRLQRYAIALKARIDARVEALTKPRLATIERMESLLRPWATLEVAKQGKKQSYKLLSGVVGFRQAPEHLEVDDEEKAVDWLESHSAAEWADCVKVKKTVKKDDIKKLIKETGEVPDGVKLVPGERRFYAEAEPWLLDNPGTTTAG